MFNRIAMALVLGLMCIGCVSAGGQNGATSVTPDDILGFVGDKLAETALIVQNGQNAAMAAIAAQNQKLEEARSAVASLEAIVGPIDADGNGEISPAEAGDFYQRAITNPEAKDLATKGDVWTKLGMLMAAAATARKLGHKLPKQLQWLTMFFGTPPGTKAPPAAPAS